MLAFPAFQLNELYSRRRDVHDRFGGNPQSGIAPSSIVPAIFLFTGDTGLKFGYRDSPEALDYCDYVGEGQVGDMSFTGGNRAVRDHARDGRSLHLFRSLGKGKQHRYLGEFSLAGFSWNEGRDRNEDLRKIIVFHLARVQPSLESLDLKDEDVSPDKSPDTLEAARQLAIAAATPPEGVHGQSAMRSIYLRSKHVRRYALMRAGGVCEACKQPAPFLRANGEPYLEVHHTQRVSDGGVDHPRNVAAICPTCHRNIHFGTDGDRVNETLVKYVLAAEP